MLDQPNSPPWSCQVTSSAGPQTHNLPARSLLSLRCTRPKQPVLTDNSQRSSDLRPLDVVGRLVCFADGSVNCHWSRCAGCCPAVSLHQKRPILSAPRLCRSNFRCFFQCMLPCRLRVCNVGAFSRLADTITHSTRSCSSRPCGSEGRSIG